MRSRYRSGDPPSLKSCASCLGMSVDWLLSQGLSVPVVISRKSLGSSLALRFLASLQGFALAGTAAKKRMGKCGQR